MSEQTYPPHDQPDEPTENKPVQDQTDAAKTTPPAPLATDLAPTAEASSTLVLVWQWLTYALWTWTLASLGVLLSATLAYFISSDTRDGDSTWLVYVIATAVCLLPISFIVDRLYSKQEPAHKRGFAAVILVIHAVFAFLVSIGSLITAVVTLLSLATDTSADSATKTTVIVSALMIAALGGLFFIRIVRPAKLRAISKRFSLIISVVAGITIIAALAGPYVATIKTKSDRQIEAGLYGVNDAIQQYAATNNKLPDSLDDLTFGSYSSNAKALVKSKLVSYRIKDDTYATTSRSYGYELCVTYKKSKGTGKVQSDKYSYSQDSYLDTYNHPAGHTCYQKSAYSYRSPTILNEEPSVSN